MAEMRLINAIPLEKEMKEYSLYIGRETTNECESTAESCADMVSAAPTIDPESMRPAGTLGHGRRCRRRSYHLDLLELQRKHCHV